MSQMPIDSVFESHFTPFDTQIETMSFFMKSKRGNNDLLRFQQ